MSIFKRFSKKPIPEFHSVFQLNGYQVSLEEYQEAVAFANQTSDKYFHTEEIFYSGATIISSLTFAEPFSIAPNAPVDLSFLNDYVNSDPTSLDGIPLASLKEQISKGASIELNGTPIGSVSVPVTIDGKELAKVISFDLYKKRKESLSKGGYI